MADKKINEATEDTGDTITDRFPVATDDGGEVFTTSGYVKRQNLLPFYMLLGYKNRIINADFDLWQRGTSFSGITVAEYTADRFKVEPAGSTMDITRQTFTPGQTDVPGNPRYYMRMDVTSAGAANSEIISRIEGVGWGAGEKVTVSFWAKASVAKTLTVRIQQNFGTGGSSQISTNMGSPTLTTSWVKYSFTVAVPSITGKTIGTEFTHSAVFNFFWSNAATGSIDIARVQMELGEVATDFEQRPIGLELALAQRYYQKTFPYATAPVQNAGVADALGYRALLAGVNKYSLDWPFKVPLRTDPTITYYNPSAANGNFRNADDAADSGVPVTDTLSPNHITIQNPQVAADGVGEHIQIHAAADAEL